MTTESRHALDEAILSFRKSEKKIAVKVRLPKNLITLLRKEAKKNRHSYNLEIETRLIDSIVRPSLISDLQKLLLESKKGKSSCKMKTKS